MKMNTEQEWQFSVAQLQTAREWLAAQPSDPSERRLAARPTLELQDTYFDSPDWMIFRAGFALRMRRERAEGSTEQTEITLKSLSVSHDGLARRQEISQRVNGADIHAVLAGDAEIGDRVRELIGARQLKPLFSANTRRERQHLLEADSGLPLAEVDLDETSIEAPGGITHELKRVEIECINATPAAIEPFVEKLRDAAQLLPVEQSKFRAGLNVAGLDPGHQEPPQKISLEAKQTFATSQFALMRKYFAAVLEKEPLVRIGSVPAVHEMRVAARHLDVLLRLFAGYGPRWAVGSRHTLRALIDSLGAVRDCDVQLTYLQESLAELPEQGRTALEPLRAQLQQQRVKARARLLHTLDSSRTRGWIEFWQEQLRLGTASGARAREANTAVVAQDLIRSLARRLRKRADRLSGSSSPDDYQKVRIRAKRLRYALNAFETLYGDAAHEYLSVLARLQQVLGDFHDSTVRSEKFAELATTGRRVPASTSFMVGRLVERDQRAFDQCRRKFPKAYRRVKRRRWNELTEVMRKAANDATATQGKPTS